MAKAPHVAGVDVGASAKGCNLVVLQGTAVLGCYRKQTPHTLLQHCREHGVVAVGIDAPCRWRIGEGARQAERDMARAGISSFSTPTLASAGASVSGFYDWMFVGMAVYQVLAADYALLEAPRHGGGKVCFETFPHAITRMFLGETASAKKKSEQRKRLLIEQGIDVTGLTSVDDRDAALCALTAQFLLKGKTRTFGDAAGGHIHVPRV